MHQALAMLSFASPLWAWGAAAAVGLPLLAHLLSRSRYREVLFPATRLVREAVIATTRVERPRHLLLMLLRLLALLFVVAAFMQPRWTPKAEALDPERGVSLIVLLDASASMQRVESGATLYQRAKRQTQVLIKGLDPSKDVASVVIVDRRPTTLLPEPTAQLDTLAGMLARTSAGYETADWSASLALASRLAAKDARQLRVVVISDQQGDGPGAVPDDGPLSEARIDHIRIDGPTENTAVRLIDLRPYPPIAGRPITAELEIENDGLQPHRTMVSATLGSHAIKRQLTLTAQSRQQIELTLPGVESGMKVMRIAVDGLDAMPADNATGAVLEVQAGPRVLIVHGGEEQRAIARRIGLMLRPGDAFDFTNALPRIAYASVEEALAIVRQTDASDLRTVVAFASPSVGRVLYPQLKAFAKRGGGVVLFATPTGAPTKPRQSANINFSLEPLQVFEGPARAGLAALNWPGGSAINPATYEQETETLLSDQTGNPLVSEKTLGRGRIVWLYSALSTGPGGLPAEPAFVVLFNELCRYASPGPTMPAPLRPGDPLPAVLSTAPDLSRPDHADPLRDAITAPGAYLATDPDGQLVNGIFAQLDEAESDTAAPEPWGLTDATTSKSIPAAAATDLSTNLRPQAIELWPYALVATLLLAGAESSLLWRFAGQRGEAP